MQRFRRALAGAIAVGLVGGAGLVSPPAFASGQPANPYAGLPPMTAWVWNGSDADPVIMFDFSGQAEGFPLNATIPSSASQDWGGIDNPAPLIWYYNNVSKTDLGDSVFGPGVQYSATLISKMEAENFAPSLVGGVNPSGMTSGSTGSTTGSTSSASGSPSSSASSSSTPPSTAPSSTAPATTTPSASTPSTTAASSATGTPPSSSTAQAAPTASASSSGFRTPSSSGSATSTTPLEPPGLKQETPPKVAQKILRHDEALVADAHHSARPTTQTPWWAWGGGVVALLAIAGGGVVWWRKRAG